MEFTLSWDAVVWRTAIGFILFMLAFLIAPGLIKRFRDPLEHPAIVQFIGIAVLSVLLGCALWVPWRYSLSGGAVRVHSVLHGYELPIKDISEMAVVNGKKYFAGAVRTGGIGGIFGISGRFATKTEREVRVDSGQISGDLVRIRMSDGRVFVLGPDDPRRFVDTVKAERAKLQGNAAIGLPKGDRAMI